MVNTLGPALPAAHTTSPPSTSLVHALHALPALYLFHRMPCFPGPLQVAETLTAWYERDVDPSLSGAARYMRERMSMEGYTHLLAAGEVYTNVRAALIFPYLLGLQVCSSGGHKVVSSSDPLS